MGLSVSRAELQRRHPNNDPAIKATRNHLNTVPRRHDKPDKKPAFGQNTSFIFTTKAMRWVALKVYASHLYASLTRKGFPTKDRLHRRKVRMEPQRTIVVRGSRQLKNPRRPLGYPRSHETTTGHGNHGY